jgi:hypothetical protein
MFIPVGATPAVISLYCVGSCTRDSFQTNDLTAGKLLLLLYNVFFYRKHPSLNLPNGLHFLQLVKMVNICNNKYIFNAFRGENVLFSINLCRLMEAYGYFYFKFKESNNIFNKQKNDLNLFSFC